MNPEMMLIIGALSMLVFGVMVTPQKFDFSQLIAAGATFNPLTDYQYETPDVPVMIELLERATAVGLVSAISSAGDTIKQEGPVQAGGTAGTTPSRLNTEPITGKGQQFQKIRIAYRNPTGAGITVDGTVIITPIAGATGRGGARRRAPPRLAGLFRRRPRRR